MGGDDALYGHGGNDLLNGGASADTMIGGRGNDPYYVDNIFDVVTENPGEGTDTVYATIHYRLPENIENLSLLGIADLQGYGNDLSNLIYGNAGNNLLNGEGGADGMVGGAGNDVYFVDHAGDAVIENVNEGNNTVFASAHFGFGANVENLVLQARITCRATATILPTRSTAMPATTSSMVEDEHIVPGVAGERNEGLATPPAPGHGRRRASCAVPHDRGPWPRFA